MRLIILLVVLLSASASAPAALTAQRQPVLRQIKVPHSYYYREMYLPQLTSGPSSVTWSPDGRELIYSMQGSLWRQTIGSEEARQLTSGPGYDYQPDWSPDGAEVVYASYRNDAVELHLLNLQSGESRPVVSNGAVNVEPRWSPDGKRIAYVSSAHEGRWHIFITSAAAGEQAAGGERITEDRNGRLPRYYYGAYDQYLSPTWSPNGQELILISNRGHIWGSGGFWRMPARSRSPIREIHYEETTWKARPDWSRDGKRVVYSSYLGGQWNHLWVMTADGGDPFQLTYGEGDATAPRWSPDGSRIAYVSNAGGDLQIQIVTVPGGSIEPLPSPQRKYLKPTGRIRLTVVDAAGRAMPARVSVTGGDGRSYGPETSWMYADDSFDRGERPFEYGYFHSTGEARVTVPTGRVDVEVSRGPEYRVERRSLQVKPGATMPLRIVLQRLANLPADGWYSGDLHIHMNYGGNYRNIPRRLAAQARAEDLHLVENLIVNKEGRIPDLSWFTGRPDPASLPGTVIVHDQEYHTSYWGHVGLLGLTRNILLPAYSGYVNTAAASLYPTNAVIMDLAHQQGGIAGYVHPFDSYPEPGDSSKPLTNELPVDVALGKVDYYEALGFVDDYVATARVWYQLLNCGFRLPAGAGTDAMANFASLRGPVGLNRVFVRSGAPLERGRWLAGLKAGRSFATNGPLLGFTLEGKGLGEEVKVLPEKKQLVARVTLRSFVPVDHLEIVSNGTVVSEIPLSKSRTSVSTEVKLPQQGSGWYLLRARANAPEYPVLDVYPYGTTSPIYVTVGGEPIRSDEDAHYFIAWLDRLRAGAQGNTDWHSEAEKQSTLDLIARARQEFERRLSR
jgi:TolB protein